MLWLPKISGSSIVGTTSAFLYTIKISQVMSIVDTLEIVYARIKHLSEAKQKDYELIMLDVNQIQSTSVSLFPTLTPSASHALRAPALNCSLNEITDDSDAEDNNSSASSESKYEPFAYDTEIKLNIKRSADYYKNVHSKISILGMFKLNNTKTDYSSEKTC